MRILVCGGRNFHKTDIVYTQLEWINQTYGIEEMCQGGARGVDTIAAGWAGFMRVPNRTYPAAWYEYGKNAGPIRNKHMLEHFKPDLVVAFPGGPGTANMIKLAEGAGVDVMKVK